MLRPIVTPSKWVPELDSLTLVCVLLALGTIGLVAELTSTLFWGRIGLYSIAFAAGIVGMVRRHRRQPRPLART